MRLDRGQMRTLVDNLRNKLGSGVVVLGGAQDDGKVALIVGVTKDLTGKLQAGKIIGPSRNRSAAQAAAVPIWPKLAAKTSRISTPH